MKNILPLLFLIITFSCSSDDSNTIAIPEKFDVKIEIKGILTTTKVLVAVNSLVVEQWDYPDLPFTAEYTHYTKGTEDGEINIAAWAYLSDINQMEVFNLYINGELVDTTNITANPYSDGTIQPTTLKFTYKL